MPALAGDPNCLDMKFTDVDSDIRLWTRFTKPNPNGPSRHSMVEVPLGEATDVWLELGELMDPKDDSLDESWEVPLTKEKATELGRYFTWLAGEMP